jgi:hypothetical protein
MQPRSLSCILQSGLEFAVGCVHQLRFIQDIKQYSQMEPCTVAKVVCNPISPLENHKSLQLPKDGTNKEHNRFDTVKGVLIRPNQAIQVLCCWCIRNEHHLDLMMDWIEDLVKFCRSAEILNTLFNLEIWKEAGSGFLFRPFSMLPRLQRQTESHFRVQSCTHHFFSGVQCGASNHLMTFCFTPQQRNQQDLPASFTPPQKDEDVSKWHPLLLNNGELISHLQFQKKWVLLEANKL